MSIKMYLLMIILICLVDKICLAQQYYTKPENDVPQNITLRQFNIRVDRATRLLRTKKLSAISDNDHVNIMMCLNSIAFSELGNNKKGDINNRYKKLEAVAGRKKYAINIVKIYPDPVPNTGLGLYFPKLKMELYGIPAAYAIFDIRDN